MTRVALVMAAVMAITGCSRDGAIGAVPCGADPTFAAPDKARSWGPDASLVLVHQDGTLERGSFRGGDWKVVGEHRFEPSTTHVQASFDERWLAMEGTRHGEHEIWLYDTASGKERLLLRRPARGEAIPQFSPDGRVLAVYANFDMEAPDDDVSGLFLFDLARGTRRHVPFPTHFAADPRKSLTQMRWSANGDSVYLFMLAIRSPDDTRVIHQVQVADERFVRIDGHFNGTDELRVTGQRVPFAEHYLLPSRSSEGALDSTDRSFHARIDAGTRELQVRDAAGKELHVATGHVGPCGSTIAIKGWVDHFLIYELDAAPYLYDAEGGRSKRLGTPGDEYFWFAERPQA